MQWQKELHKANQNLCLQKQNKTKTQNQKNLENQKLTILKFIWNQKKGPERPKQSWDKKKNKAGHIKIRDFRLHFSN